MTPIPLTVIGGYLGAGKTTLINQLLNLDLGVKFAVLVNDFGSINIDAALLKSASEDTIELTNGCICCSMSGDLFFAIGDLLDRPNAPDHILVEASGIADPTKIANVAHAEMDLRYSGIVTVFDGLNVTEQLFDPRISDQILSQFHCADLIYSGKVRLEDIPDEAKLPLGDACPITDIASTVGEFIFGERVLRDQPTTGFGHPSYVQWSLDNPEALLKPEIEDRLSKALQICCA